MIPILHEVAVMHCGHSSWFTYQPAMPATARLSRSVIAHHHHHRIRTDKSIAPPTFAPIQAC
jgi:hypothetical protein